MTREQWKAQALPVRLLGWAALVTVVITAWGVVLLVLRVAFR